MTTEAWSAILDRGPRAPGAAPGCVIVLMCEIRPHVSAALAAHRADETKLNVGQPDVIRPAVTADGDRVAAGVVGAIDDVAAHTSPNVIFCGCSVIWSALCRPLFWAGLDSK